MLEDLKPPVKHKGTCKVAIIAEGLSDSDKTILLNAVADAGTWPIKTLSKALADKNINISDSPLTNHRNKTCVCFRMS